MQSLKNIAQAPATMIQKQFWFIQEMAPLNTAYNIISCFEGNGQFNSEAAQKALFAIVQNHPVLRSSIQYADGEVSMVPISPEQFQLVEHDLTGNSFDNDTSSIDDALLRTAQTPFLLDTGPLLRADLFRLAGEEFVFLLVMHHGIIDLHSKRLFATEFARLYNSFTSNQTPQSVQSAFSYAQYAEWQRTWLKSDDLKKMEAAWKKELESQSGVLNLPTDFPRKDRQELKGAVVEFALTETLFRNLETYCAQKKTDKFLVLLTAYLILLHKHTNQTDITIGVPLSNRRHKDFKDVMGCFVNVLPLAFELNPDATFDDLLKQVRQKMLFAHRNQELPIQNLLSAIKPAGIAGANPIYQTAFTVEPRMEMQLDGLVMKPKKIHHGGAQLDLFLTFFEITSSVLGYFEYDVNLFHRHSIEKLCRRYLTILERHIANSSIRLRDLNIIDNDERYWLVTLANQTQRDLPDLRLHQMVSQKTQEQPDKTAVQCGENRLSYRELDIRSNQLANYLQQCGVEKGCLAGVYLHRSTDMVLAILAILKCGAAYVPLDPKFPTNRLNYIAGVTAIPVLITQKSLSGKLELNGATEICMDAEIDTERISLESTTPPQCSVDGLDRAYVLFTSGTTGKPKGIAIHHDAVVNFLLSMAREPGITPDDNLLAITTLSFDISILELFLPLTTGATVSIATSEQAVNGEELLKLIHQTKVTILQGTPSTWQMLLAAGIPRMKDFKILCGGEALPPRLAEQLCEISSDVWNLYGPTETTIWSTVCRVEKDSPIRIGHPIDNTQIYIVDEFMNLVPQGIPGELVIGGKGVSYGYLNRADLNETKFLDDPFQNDFSNRVYRTGDLARYHLDGSLEHLGRTDSQIKLRGFRIELGEIENAITAFPNVRQCAVVLAQKSSTDSRLVAYISHSAAQPLDESKIKAFLRDSLPDYMVPAFFEQLAQLPLTANGKIDRKQLPAPTWSGTNPDEPRTRPTNTIQQNLLSIWASVLGTDDIDINDNFFDVGGNSLLIMTVTNQIEKQMKFKIPVTDFFQYPTIASLSKYLLANDANTSTAAEEARIRTQKRNLARNRRNQRPI